MLALLGTRKGLLTYALDDDGRWQFVRHAHLGVPVPYAFIDERTGTWWASLDHGHWGPKLSRSDDGGLTWEEATCPAHAEGDLLKPDVAASVKYLWVLGAGAADQPGRLYAGTEPGGLFVSDDDGATWSLNRGLWDSPNRMEQWMGGGRDEAGIHSVITDPRDSRRQFVAVSCAGVFETTDDGASWTPRNKGLAADFLPDPTIDVGHDPHILVQSRANPDVFWQQNHCGIYVSRDATMSWTEVSETDGPASFGFVIATADDDADTAWVVPGDSDMVRVAVDGAVCVCRTQDGGATWEALREGLPQEQAYDITYRHAMYARGDMLMFGSTTGNVFASNDRGESWSELTHTAPMVYSVRFHNA